MDLIILYIDYSGSVVDGPGIRTIVFVQGCEQRCEGCHNPETWDKKNGISRTVDDLIIELRAKVHNRKLTISGGEPLLQPDAILALTSGLRDFNIVLYTGFELEDVPQKLLKHLDYIKVGKFEKEKCCTDIPFIGSFNQRFICLKKDNS